MVPNLSLSGSELAAEPTVGRTNDTAITYRNNTLNTLISLSFVFGVKGILNRNILFFWTELMRTGELIKHFNS
jgi:hypothetical protein